MLKGRSFGNIMRAGIIAGALFGAELNNYSKEDTAAMNTAVFMSERADVAGAPNFVKETVLGPDVCPSFKVAMSSIKASAREIWLRADKNNLDLHYDDALTARKLVDIWQYLCEDSDEWRDRPEDPISMLQSRLEYFWFKRGVLGPPVSNFRPPVS